MSLYRFICTSTLPDKEIALSRTSDNYGIIKCISDCKLGLEFSWLLSHLP